MILRIKNNQLLLRDDLILNASREQIQRDVSAYLQGNLKEFKYSYDLTAFTSFQRRVWREMQRIPFGETISYKELAEKIKKPRAFRAVANACGANPLPILIPCHRVTASNGWGGYSLGLELKKSLLKLERVNTSKAP